MKLNVHVMSARIFENVEGNDSTNPYVKVTFEGRRFFTDTIQDTLSPSWNETFTFNISNPKEINRCILRVAVYHANQPSGSGKANIAKITIPSLSFVPEPDASMVTHTLPGTSTHSVGEIMLRIYTTKDSSDSDDDDDDDDDDDESDGANDGNDDDDNIDGGNNNNGDGDNNGNGGGSNNNNGNGDNNDGNGGGGNGDNCCCGHDCNCCDCIDFGTCCDNCGTCCGADGIIGAILDGLTDAFGGAGPAGCGGAACGGGGFM